MKRAIVGTAGHIDHGKTKLVEALTGIDCDRWAEEKRRGITIDLGFAHLEEGDVEIGFVDVPGHEKFVHNALAGLGGIRILLLVVAADEGVKPQTREHLAIASLLPIPAAVVALSKVDLASPELVELASLEIQELLAPTPFADAPILPVSSRTGEGIDDLRRRLVELADRFAVVAEEGEPVRLPIDRAFVLKGLGPVVTGTLVSGRIRLGDALALLPAGGEARVRSIQVHGRSRDVALAGERTALQLAGAGVDVLRRGGELVTPGAYATTTSLAVRLRLLPDAPRRLAGSVPVRLHLLAGETIGRLRPLDAGLEPGAGGLAEIKLARPIVAVRGDRFIVRRPSPPATLGGGEVLDPLWRGARGAARRRRLEALSGDLDQALLAWIELAGEAGIELAELGMRLGPAAAGLTARLAALVAAQKLLAVPAGPGHGERWLAPGVYRRVAERARRVLTGFFRRERLARGMPKAEAVARILGPRGAEIEDVYLAWLEAQGILVRAGDLVGLPGREAELTGEESRLAARVRQRFEQAGLAPPSPAELAAELEAKPQILAGVVRYLVERGTLVRLPSGLFLAASVLGDVRSRLMATGWDRFSVGDFKERFQLTRKWAIPLLEHLDSEGFTRRVGDQRMIVRSGADNAPPGGTASG